MLIINQIHGPLIISVEEDILIDSTVVIEHSTISNNRNMNGGVRLAYQEGDTGDVRELMGLILIITNVSSNYFEIKCGGISSGNYFGRHHVQL